MWERKSEAWISNIFVGGYMCWMRRSDVLIPVIFISPVIQVLTVRCSCVCVCARCVRVWLVSKQFDIKRWGGEFRWCRNNENCQQTTSDPPLTWNSLKISRPYEPCSTRIVWLRTTAIVPQWRTNCWLARWNDPQQVQTKNWLASWR